MLSTTEERWENYRLANTTRPEARERELRHLFSLLNPAPGEHIWESGTGNGYLTFPLARAVHGGRVTTTDVVAENIADVLRRNEEGLPIDARHLQGGLLGEAEVFDAVTSIATLHHFDNRTEGTGERGREAALRSFYRALKPGGRLVLSDVLHDTITQRYFDAINDPRYCAPHGHPHDFFTADRLQELAHEIGFRDIKFEVRAVPWTFASLEDAHAFVHTIHNAQVSPEESFALAERVLGFSKAEQGYELGWELFYLTARK